MKCDKASFKKQSRDSRKKKYKAVLTRIENAKKQSRDSRKLENEAGGRAAQPWEAITG